MKSTTTANEHANKEYACLLAFDVKIMPDAETFATENGIQIFTAKIIYHLFDEFTEYVEKCRNERKADKGGKAVFPCILQVSYSIIRRNLGHNFCFIVYKDGTRRVLPYNEPDRYRCQCSRGCSQNWNTSMCA